MKPSYLRLAIHDEDGKELNHVVLNDAVLLGNEGLPQLKLPLLTKACEILLDQIKEVNANQQKEPK